MTDPMTPTDTNDPLPADEERPCDCCSDDCGCVVCSEAREADA